MADLLDVAPHRRESSLVSSPILYQPSAKEKMRLHPAFFQYKKQTNKKNRVRVILLAFRTFITVIFALEQKANFYLISRLLANTEIAHLPEQVFSSVTNLVFYFRVGNQFHSKTPLD